MSRSKWLIRALAVFAFVAFLAIYSMKSGGSSWSEWDDEKMEEEHEGSSGEVQRQNDFKSEAKPIPRKDWAKVDNTNCYTKESGDGADMEPWQRRAPYFLIIGAMKAGTTTLNTFLGQHSHIVKSRRKELHFYDFAFKDYVSSKGILRRSARKAYAEIYREFVPVKELSESPSKVALDDSPRYLFWSDRIPARILCVTPWVKILAVLRNPIDRAFSQYNMFLNNKPINITFENWIEQDLKDLKETGVIQDKIPQISFSGSKREAAAWKAYTRMGTHAPIGRGFYALQLRQWFDAFEEAEKSLDDILIIQSERMKEDPDLVYKNVLEFLELPDEPLKDDQGKLVGTYKVELHPDTRAMLEALYDPYNKELYDMLGESWSGVWDP